MEDYCQKAIGLLSFLRTIQLLSPQSLAGEILAEALLSFLFFLTQSFLLVNHSFMTGIILEPFVHRFISFGHM